jgi:hypothetical protein
MLGPCCSADSLKAELNNSLAAVVRELSITAISDSNANVSWQISLADNLGFAEPHGSPTTGSTVVFGNILVKVP